MKFGFCVMANIDEIGFYPHVEALGYDSVWVADSHRRLIATLRQFSFPIVTNMSGDGSLQPGIAPTTESPTFTWEGFASS